MVVTALAAAAGFSIQHSGTVESPPGDGDLLSSSELARLLGVHAKTVARWRTDNGLPCIRTTGGHRRYRWSDVTAWLERGDA